MHKHVASNAEDLTGLRNDYQDLMQQLQSRQNMLRSKFTDNVQKATSKRSRRQQENAESSSAKRKKMFENKRSEQVIMRNHKTSTPCRSRGHSRTRDKMETTTKIPNQYKPDRTTLNQSPDHHKLDSTGLKFRKSDNILSRHSTIKENEDLVFGSGNRRPKRPYPTPLRTSNTSSSTWHHHTSTPKSIIRSKNSPNKKISSSSVEKKDTAVPRRSLRLSRSPHFHSEALRLDYHNEMKKRRRLSNSMNNSYTAQLDHTGNNRPKPVRTEAVTQGPRSILLPGHKTKKTPNRVSFRLHDASPGQSLLDQSGRVQPLLGYDWIAGLLDAEDTISERSDAFFDELKDFRRVNREDCVYRQIEDRSSSATIPGLPTPTITHPTDTHQCLHNYTLNDRLFVVPVHGNQQGESTCPICHESRTAEVKRGSPSYIRVSIPRSTLRSPYKLRPHRRRSFDATDTLGLSQHCLAGWENSRPSMLPMATNIDLKDALRPQSLREGTVGNENLYNSSKRLPLVPTERTQRLLNRSRSIQNQLNRMKNKHA
ncbi:uncharacterized protein [Antedon mediterranea]|uniref:uncharacterized protein n=1 Tax=Antedon mediterranea TaxID=105859 RepID=UPI003AF7537A